jgi:WD40 repeat protein
VAYVLGSHGLAAWRTGNGSRLALPAFAGEDVRDVIAADSAPRLVLVLQARIGGTWRVVSLNPLTGSVSALARDRPDAIAIDPNARVVIMASGRVAHAVNLDSKRRTSLWARGGKARGSLVTISADGRRAAVAGADFLDVFDVASGNLLAQLPAARSARISAVTISHDGALAAAGYADGQATLWSSASGRQVLAVKTAKQAWQDTGVTSLRISDDGDFLLTSVPDNSTTIWDVASGSQLERFDGDFAGWSTDSRTVVTTGGPLEAWKCDVCARPAALRTLARARATRSFSHDEQAKFLIQ